LLRPVERAAYDARFDVRGDRAPDRRIAIVAYDENSVPRLPPFPIPRSYYAALIDRLPAAGARMILFDIAFDGQPPAEAAGRAPAGRAAPVIFGTPEIAADGRTVTLGGAQTLRRVNARVAALRVRLDGDGELRRVPWAIHGVPSMPVLAARVLGADPQRGDF